MTFHTKLSLFLKSPVVKIPENIWSPGSSLPIKQGFYSPGNNRLGIKKAQPGNLRATPIYILVFPNSD